MSTATAYLPEALDRLSRVVLRPDYHVTRAAKAIATAQTKDRNLARAILIAAPITAPDANRLTERDLEDYTTSSTAIETVAPKAWSMILTSEQIASNTEPYIPIHETNAAGIRGHLSNSSDYGPIVSRAVRVRYLGHSWAQGETQEDEMIFRGPLSAHHRGLPDLMTREAWQQAGAVGLDDHGTPRLMKMECLN